MPKKFRGENTKSAEARARKECQKQVEKERVDREKEEEFWRDDDKHALKKQQRKEDRDKKKQEALERKLASKALLEKELGEVASKGMERIQSASKITQASISAQIDKDRNEKAKEEENRRMEKKKLTVQDDLLVENLNHLVIEGEHARTIDEAIRIVSDKPEETDKHPEKRMKSAYSAFETRMMPILKQKHPSFRLSQLKQVLWKEWQKSPENPLVQKMLQADN